MTDFHRFPHTPHLAWLGKGVPREDKVLSRGDATTLFSQELVVEEKIDGANLGFSVDDDGVLLAQNRGSWLSPDACHPQFRSLWPWLAPRRDALIDALWPDLMLFGEWCAAVHSVEYDALPDWFLGFDVFDRSQGHFWSTRRRDALLNRLGLRVVPNLGRGRFDLGSLTELMATSQVGSVPMEGVYVRTESASWLQKRAKLVRPEFVQNIEAHWSSAPMRRNRLLLAAWV
ncbi:MAG: RNA ligase family protein [Deltaproteobacteria bacterium]|nr:RNA ligase family protein [Deltaproteobacteria bacterium]